jgi:Flp pilus assembly protein TadG
MQPPRHMEGTVQRSALRRSIRNDRGVALVEFALVLPLFLLLLVGMLDFGKAFTYWIDETHLANEAARFAAVNKKPTGATSIEDYVTDQARAETVAVKVYLLGPAAVKGDKGEALCVFVQAGTKLNGAAVPVYEFIEFLNLGPEKTLKAQSVMRIETEYKGDGTDAYTSAPGAIPSECT